MDSNFQPTAVFPLHDPQGTTFPHLDLLSSDLKSIFSNACVGVTPVTYERCPEQVKSLEDDRFFTLFYARIEQFATTVGELLFGRRLDFTWCHLAITAAGLAKAIAQAGNHDLSVLAEMTLAIREEVRMRDVDWLEWEDPFLLDRPAQELKREREGSVEETEKRLAYVLPTVQTLRRHARR